MDANSSAREYLDTRLMRQCLENLKVKVDPQTTSAAGTILLRGLGVGLFLCGLS